jgi:hypothetical protein
MHIFFKPREGSRRPHRGRALARRRPLAVSAAALFLGLVSVANAPADATARKVIPPSGIQIGIDGFAPSLYRSIQTGNIQQAWTLAHHAYAPEDADKVSCVDVITGTPCPGPDGQPTTWPKPLNIFTGPLGAHNSHTGNLSTTQAPNGIIQTDATRVLRYPAVTQTPIPTGNGEFLNGSVGIGCLNMVLQANCPYVPLAPLTTHVGSNINGISGLVAIGNKIYGRLTNGQMACMDVLAGTPCPGQPYNGISPPSNDKAGLGPQNYEGGLLAINDRIYTKSNGLNATTTTSPHLPTLTCFDTTTNAPCANWGARVINDQNLSEALSIFPSYDRQGNITGVCTITGKSTPGVVTACYDFFGNDAVVPQGLRDLIPQTGDHPIVFPPLNAVVNGNRRMYFPFYTQDAAQTHKGETHCFDWTTQSHCSGFPIPLTHPMVNGGMTHDYGYTYDAQTQCVFGTGHFGFLFTFDALTGSHNCS